MRRPKDPGFSKFLFWAIVGLVVVWALSGCAPRVVIAPCAACVAECPDRSKIPAPTTVGEQSLQLIDAERQYGACRGAALGLTNGSSR